MTKTMMAYAETPNDLFENYVKLAGFALILSIISIVLSSHIHTLAFDTQPMFGDGAYQFMYSADVYLDFLYNGRLIAMWNAFATNPRPVWAILPLLISPNLLININGHIIVGGIFLFCFLSVMGISIFKRTHSLLYAFLCMGAVLSAEYFYHFSRGMGGNYTDLQTAWLIGAALFALINSDYGKQGEWLLAFSFFAALAQQSRFVSLGVTAFVCGPILCFYLLRRWQSTHSGKALWMFIAQLFVPLFIISGYSSIKFVGTYIKVYFLSPAVSSGLSNMFKSQDAAIDLFFRVYDYHLGRIGIILLLFIFVAYFVFYWQIRSNTISLLVSLWAAVAFPVLHIFILRIADEWIYTVYMLPGLYLLAFIPFSLSPEKLMSIRLKPEIPKVFCFGLFIITIFININNFSKISNSVKVVSESEQQLFNYQKDLSTILSGLIEKYYPGAATIDEVPTFESFVEIGALTSAQPIYIDTWYRHRQMIRWVFLSKVWKGIFETNYPNQSLEQIQKLTYQASLEKVDLVIILERPHNKKAVRLSTMYPHLESDEWNLKINEYMYKQINENKQDWVGEEISGQLTYKSPYGNIRIFRNLSRYIER